MSSSAELALPERAGEVGEEPSASRPGPGRPDEVKLGLLSLGCDKNTVDSERMLAALAGHGARRVEDLGEAEVVVVNTCAFIDAAKEESIDTLLRVAELKRDGACRAVVAVGCMVERYREELVPELPEVDLWLGLRDLDRLVPELRERDLLGDPLADHPGTRLPLVEGGHVRYLKVSEGCDHGCAFCAIPLWRGRHRSFELERLVAEARRLEAQGAVEVNLVAQDLAHYGRELRDGTGIHTLLERLLEETEVPWFRLLYIYSAGLRDPLIELIAREDRVLPYIDMPIQHAADPVLERMRRPERRDTLREKIRRLRGAIPELTLRTTVMVGFPGETEEDFRTLLDFMEEARFDRLGAFAFSPQEGTRAAGMEDDFVPEEVARERLEELLEVQRAIAAERMAAEVGRRRPAIVDHVSGAPPGGASGTGPDGAVPAGRRAGAGVAPEGGTAGAGVRRGTGRLRSQADDVDGVTELRSPVPLRRGQIVEVEVTAASDFDLEARVLRVLREAPDAGEREVGDPGSGDRGGAEGGRTDRGSGGPRSGRTADDRERGSRSLPVAGLGLDTAWGK